MRKNHVCFKKWLLRQVCKKGYFRDFDQEDLEIEFQKGFVETSEFFKRLGNNVCFKNKTVLDFGCGLGSTCFYMAFKGAKKVVGTDIDVDRISFAKLKTAEYENIAKQLEFELCSNMSKEKFDIVLSKDCFEHYANPKALMRLLRSHLRQNGKLVVGFSPLWKSPYGAHLTALTKFPWVHASFPESLVMEEVRRFFKNQTWQTYRDIPFCGGLNQITLQEFLKIAEETAFEFEYLKINAASDPKLKILFKTLSIARKIPYLSDYFAINLYSIMKLKTDSEIS